MFAQTPALTAPIGPFIILSKVESTNNYAMAKLHAALVETGTCFLALEQTAGKGQRGKQWLARPGENITMSTVFTLSHSSERPGNSAILRFPFLLSAAMALGCYDFTKALQLPDLYIKWPNDIYSGDRKAAGILIENLFKGSDWEWAVAGTGINLNQTAFGELEEKAISVKTATGIHNELIPAGRLLHTHLCERFAWLRDRSPMEIMDEYNSRLYKKGLDVRLKKGSMIFTTRIKEVSVAGELVTNDTLERRFRVGEVEFL